MRLKVHIEIQIQSFAIFGANNVCGSKEQVKDRLMNGECEHEEN
jgi:hypothetical protein